MPRFDWYREDYEPLTHQEQELVQQTFKPTSSVDGRPSDLAFDLQVERTRLTLDERTRPLPIDRDEYLPEFADRITHGAWQVFPSWTGNLPAIVYRPRD